MKLRWIITVGVALASAVCLFLLLRPRDGEQEAVAETRRALREQGFKTDLADFDFSVSDEMRERVAALTNADFLRATEHRMEYPHRAALQEGKPELMKAVTQDSALVVWKLEKLESQSGEDIWPLLREVMAECRPELDAACEASLLGSIQFHLVAAHGSAMQLPHLVALEQFEQALGQRAVLALHDGDRDAAWTNLLAATRLAAAYAAEPAEISQLVRFACADIASRLTWQVLQAKGWPDDHLAGLQREWESAVFFKSLPETAAFARASTVATCQQERLQPIGWSGLSFAEAIRSPRYAWMSVVGYRRQLNYRHYGTYADEKALLLFYRDRELELRHVLRSPTWPEMRQLPGVTNRVFFQSKYPSAMQCFINTRQLSLSMHMYDSPGASPGYPRSLVSRAADTESRRRVICAAIAIERYRGRHGSYPEALDQLVPEFLKSLATDFMDGQPLRYRRTEDGHFVLYSVGLDCVDDGGVMSRSEERWSPVARAGVLQKSDLVWPRPATAADLEAWRAEQEALRLEAMKARQREDMREREEESEEEWRQSPLRQARVKDILATKWSSEAEKMTYEGKPLGEAIRNRNVAGTEQLSLAELLTPRQIITGHEPEDFTFEFPVSYDAITNLGFLLLLDADLDPGSMFASDSGAQMQERVRATNGNCRLVWHSIFDPPGQHALQVQISGTERSGAEFWLKGPAISVVSSNLCQFSLASAYFEPESGATLQARVPEPHCHFTVELRTTNGIPLKTITGSTSNGTIKVHWGLLDERGNRCTNEAFGSVFHITLPESGRSQTLNGP